MNINDIERAYYRTLKVSRIHFQYTYHVQQGPRVSTQHYIFCGTMVLTLP
jgi:hypothetical protein